MIYYCEIEKEGGDISLGSPICVKMCGESQKEALFMAEDAVNAVLESEIEHGFLTRSPVYKNEYLIPVSNNILLSLQLRRLHGNRSRTDAAKKIRKDLPIIPALGKSA